MTNLYMGTSLFLVMYFACLIAAAAIKYCAGNKPDKGDAKFILCLLFWPIALPVVIVYGLFSLIGCFLNIKTLFKTAFGKGE